MAKEAAAHQNESSAKAAGQNSTHAVSSAHGNTVGASQKELGNYLNLPPSGKSGKKSGNNNAATGSSSSRARNVSHVTNRDSDKEQTTAKKGKKQSAD